MSTIKKKIRFDFISWEKTGNAGLNITGSDKHRMLKKIRLLFKCEHIVHRFFPGDSQYLDILINKRIFEKQGGILLQMHEAKFMVR